MTTHIEGSTTCRAKCSWDGTQYSYPLDLFHKSVTIPPQFLLFFQLVSILPFSHISISHYRIAFCSNLSYIIIFLFLYSKINFKDIFVHFPIFQLLFRHFQSRLLLLNFSLHCNHYHVVLIVCDVFCSSTHFSSPTYLS